MLLDTGAEVTIVSNAFMEQLFPGQELPDHGGEVRSFAGAQFASGPPGNVRHIFGFGFLSAGPARH